MNQSTLEVRHLRTLVALRDSGSLVRAAQLLNLTQSALSHQVKLLEDRYAALLVEGRYRDAAAGRTLEGPHRVDLLVRHREKDMQADRCSTGEQKALLVGLILAHAQLIADMTGHAPVLLLDEIAAHLDVNRRAALFDRIHALGGQAFMTGTDRSMFAALGERAQYFTVREATVTEESL